MTNSSDKIVKTVNKLIEINNDRVAGYETAAKETHDPSLKSRFTGNAEQSRRFRSELETLVREHGGKPDTGTSASGKVYRGWMDAKAAATGDSNKAILSSCEFGEDTAKRAYESALKDTSDLPQDVVSVISHESEEILKAHNEIKQLRDSQKN